MIGSCFLVLLTMQWKFFNQCALSEKKMDKKFAFLIHTKKKFWSLSSNQSRKICIFHQYGVEIFINFIKSKHVYLHFSSIRSGNFGQFHQIKTCIFGSSAHYWPYFCLEKFWSMAESRCLVRWSKLCQIIKIYMDYKCQSFYSLKTRVLFEKNWRYGTAPPRFSGHVSVMFVCI